MFIMLLLLLLSFFSDFYILSLTEEKEVTVLHNNPTEKDKPWSNVRPITLNSRIKLSRNKAIRYDAYLDIK